MHADFALGREIEKRKEKGCRGKGGEKLEKLMRAVSENKEDRRWRREDRRWRREVTECVGSKKL